MVSIHHLAEYRSDSWCGDRFRSHLLFNNYSRLVDRWVALVGLDSWAFGTHGLRRTMVALVYKRTGNI